MKAVVLAAGRGTRMRPLTDGRPKPLLPVGGSPLVEHVLERCSSAGIEESVLVVGYGADRVEEAIGDTYRGMEVSYAEQEEARGTGDAVLCAGPLDDDFLVLNGDIFFTGDLLGKLSNGSGNAMAVKEVDDPEGYGAVVVEDGSVREISEKSGAPPSSIVNAGAYRFGPEIFDALEGVGESPRGEIELTGGVEKLDDVSALDVEGQWLDVGYPWDLIEANEWALEELEEEVSGHVEEGAVLRGPVSVGEGSVVRSGAYVEGPVRIGEGCDVGPNCYVRPSTSLGDGVRVGSGVEVKNSVLMSGATVGHLSYVGDSVLGEGCNLGAGTVTANLRHDGATVEVYVKGEAVDSGRRKLGAVVGDGAKTGVNTSLDPGAVLGTSFYTEPGEYLRGTNP